MIRIVYPSQVFRGFEISRSNPPSLLAASLGLFPPVGGQAAMLSARCFGRVDSDNYVGIKKSITIADQQDMVTRIAMLLGIGLKYFT